jgi:hypothetical protein
MGVPYKEFDGMFTQKTTLGINLFDRQFDGIDTVFAIKRPRAGDCEINPQVIGVRRQAVARNCESA